MVRDGQRWCEMDGARWVYVSDGGLQVSLQPGVLPLQAGDLVLQNLNLRRLGNTPAARAKLDAASDSRLNGRAEQNEDEKCPDW